ncbi:MAG: 50S ribosomal protein L11 methyltransferase [Bacteroidetes bacterium]|nr:50S ribosomal protein L11 methyltransferase [Bacteroidota bacterium]
MDYIEVNFELVPLHPFDDILTAELAEVGFESFVNLDTGLQAFIQKGLFDAAKLAKLLAAYAERGCKISFTKKEIPAQNWNASWESNFEPIDVDGICTVRAPFHPKTATAKYDIIIEPKMSFGTGHHETTYLMLQQLLAMNIAGKSLLDMGCGTSVLAILAAKLTAKEVLAIDNDSWSYENSLENCALNSCPQICVKLGDAALLKGHKFNIILANINRNILLNDMFHYYAALEEKGELLISGFFDVDTPLLFEHAQKLGFHLVKKITKNNWALIGLQK